MLSDLKHKRQVAGFIRTNSFKALPTFKNTVKNQSSQDFSSFQNDKAPQQSDQQFSPYKDSPKNKSKRPPLPHKSQHHNNYPPSSNYQSNKNIEHEKDPIQIFTNQKLKRNYEIDVYGYKSTHINNYPSESPNCGKIVNKHKMGNVNSNLNTGNRREEQIKQNLRKRAEVQKQLAEIDKICLEIDHIRNPNQLEQKYQKPSAITPKSQQKQSNIHRNLYRKELQQQMKKPALSYQKYKYVSKQQQSKKYIPQIKIDTQKPQKIHSQTPKVAFAPNTQNNSILNNQGRKSFPTISSKPNHQLLSTYEPKQSKKVNINSQTHLHFQKEPIKSTVREHKPISTAHQAYQFQEQNSQFDDDSNFSSTQNPIKESKQEQQFSSFKYEQTFKPNANQQILNTIQQYKNHHPSQYQNGNKKNQKQSIENYSRSKSTSQIQSDMRSSVSYEDRIKNQHDRARQKFFSTKQQKKSDLQHEESENEDEESDDEYDEEQQEQEFSQLEQKNYQRKNYGQDEFIEQEQQQLITEYPTGQFKKISIKECVQSKNPNLSHYSSQGPKNQNQNFNQMNNHSNVSHKIKTMQPVLENNSGIHKSKGGICFDLDINQFTQFETKPAPKQPVQPIRRNKKTNTKEQILKRRQIAKNYDKQARARVFGAY